MTGTGIACTPDDVSVRSRCSTVGTSCTALVVSATRMTLNACRFFVCVCVSVLDRNVARDRFAVPVIGTRPQNVLYIPPTAALQFVSSDACYIHLFLWCLTCLIAWNVGTIFRRFWWTSSRPQVPLLRPTGLGSLSPRLLEWPLP